MQYDSMLLTLFCSTIRICVTWDYIPHLLM